MSLLRRIHRTLVPEEVELGVGPYIWLFYSFFLFIPMFTGRADRDLMVWSLGTFPVFLALYFYAFRLTGWPLRLVVAAITALGLLTLPHNWGAMTYFVFAASFAAFVGPPREGLVMIACILAVFTLEWWLIDGSIEALLITTLVTTIVGTANVVWRVIHVRNKAIQASREEIERLGALAERERIARDLHDVLGHTLSSITLKAALAVRIMERDPQRARKEMEEVEAISRDALAQARSAVSGYRLTGVIDEIGRGRKLLASAGITLHAEVSDLPELPPSLDNVLGLAVREAFTNVARHSGAGACWVVVEHASDRMNITVRDDGKGGDLERGSGLTGMLERIEGSGGHVSFGSIDGRGVTVSIHMPLPAKEAGQHADAGLLGEPSA